jgi:hypothetical protein
VGYQLTVYESNALKELEYKAMAKACGFEQMGRRIA